MRTMMPRRGLSRAVRSAGRRDATEDAGEPRRPLRTYRQSHQYMQIRTELRRRDAHILRKNPKRPVPSNLHTQPNITLIREQRDNARPLPHRTLQRLLRTALILIRP